jgi:tRNA-specific 2-thiouridylase
MKKVIVGMSGGTDSTVAAYLLKKKGFEVVGITLSLWDGASRCCNLDDIMDAKNSCSRIGIKHYTLNAKNEFKKNIVEYFINDYLSGKTPNPCVMCNRDIKFMHLLKKMRELDFDYVATGHYAEICKKGGRYVLRSGSDRSKSQEYFLARLDQDDLKHILLPLGRMHKKDVKKTALKYGLLREKKDSQEVCFLREKETPYEFIMNNRGYEGEPGGLYHKDGQKIKDLDTAYFKYTVGQRKGLGFSGGRPMYVIGVDAMGKKVVIGGNESLYSKKITVKGLNMLCTTKKVEFMADVRVRYQQGTEKAKLRLNGDTAEIEFIREQYAVTPGQLAVFYRGKTVLGSGFISDSGIKNGLQKLQAGEK